MSVKWKEYKKNMQIRPVFVNGKVDHWLGQIVVPIVEINAHTADALCAELNKIIKENK